MSIKSMLAVLVAKYSIYRQKKWSGNALKIQEKTLYKLLRIAKNTQFAKDHAFKNIRDYQSFKKEVPIRDYEGLKPYFDKIKEGEKDVMWPGKPIYLSKTSGTTSGTKYIPITRHSMPNHINTARSTILNYIINSGNADFMNGKFIFIQGSPILTTMGGIKTGRLSGIVAHHIPSYLQNNRLPSMATNSIEDWEEKIDAIVEETVEENLTIIAGIPPWVQMYFEKLMANSGKDTLTGIFTNLQLYITGGVNFEPYRKTFDTLIGKKINTLETYPASEGFIAFQDTMPHKGMLLQVNDGIFYEFIPADQYFDEEPERLWLKDVELDVNYALIINSNAGLWGYSIGDTIRFVSKDPYRIAVTGRIKHFISAFGEHVIAEEVEAAINDAMNVIPAKINEFTVAPQVTPEGSSLPYHEWFVEFEKKPEDLQKFSLLIDESLQNKNSYYADLIQGKILQPLVISPIVKNGFQQFMKNRGKLGGQNKIPRLSNDRLIAEELNKLIERGI